MSSGVSKPVRGAVKCQFENALAAFDWRGGARRVGVPLGHGWLPPMARKGTFQAVCGTL